MYKKYFKRLFDIIFSLILLPFLLPVIAICAFFIKIEDKGPIFYLGERLGKDKKQFKMYKLRSMKVNSPDLRNEDGSTFNSENDPRLTNIGRFIRKTSLDELPQIINVFIGDMSFIGPRPDLPEALNFYSEEEIHKLDVRPGITGYNQAYFRNSIAQSEKFRNDIFYVKNISLILDIKIIVATIISVIRRKNINTKNEGIYKN
ncbi:UDP-phosphate galactose phosphotransferase [Anaerobacillus alkalilacustris]|uniref:UDP-phosphate galactose phosphotransferase n=1 Tax=Anaerobacillus alkalilacustris TaxID=393763 RepID=A0A1S2LFU4_9BACI|nr:sugar transferase [Anaerobacillus alkalilacustris]OIJ11261.1 UDP-phosphate galactose phosphotransferase [Anaerobacillus alkalilacustris]